MSTEATKNSSWVVKKGASDAYELVCIDIPCVEVDGGCVRVKIEYSCLNYKDMLTVSGKNGETKSYPQAIGIDAVGVVEQSANNRFKTGQRVAQFSRGLGTTRGGGLSHYIGAEIDSLVALPSAIDSYKAIALGTAGLTAAACVTRIMEEKIDPNSGPILVTGASGGVGRIALLMLSRLGYQIVASTRRGVIQGDDSAQTIPPLKRTHFNLLPQKWVAVLDTLGGNSLETSIKSTYEGGLVLSVGMVSSPFLNLSVYPFVLRGIKLIGVNLDRFSTEEIMKFLSLADSLISLDDLTHIVKVIEFDEVPRSMKLLAQGKHSGRTVVRVQSVT